MGDQRKHAEYVYFAWSEKTQLMKVGYSATPKWRVRQIGREYRLIRTFHGNRLDERNIHGRLRDCWASGELFRFRPFQVESLVRSYLRERRMAEPLGDNLSYNVLSRLAGCTEGYVRGLLNGTQALPKYNTTTWDKIVAAIEGTA